VKFNDSGWVNAITVDIDRNWETAKDTRYSPGMDLLCDSLTPPNLVMRNPENGRVHGTWWLDQPVWTQSRREVQNYVRNIHRRLTVHHSADMGFTNHIWKNPLWPSWNTFLLRESLYTLDELDGALPWVRPDIRHDPGPNGLGRNCTLFDRLRHWGYEHVMEYHLRGDLLEWRRQCEYQAELLNQEFNPSLPMSEARSVAKSVSNWTWENVLTCAGRKERHDGIMELSPDLELSYRQSLGAHYTNDKIRLRTEQRIRAALVDLGPSATQKEVACHIGMSERTVIRYWRLRDICFVGETVHQDI
jgi:hypothetical protein